ncbi:MerR family transcriptional regulator, heat shock protein HspR [Paraoerskovia marina]|uniref:MerR family transcriptional regulator, heat shock protein HspR n=1 Tax=Paraoerskovia marina TaxID=545619 RepID=A0A1H1PFB6_9CELL|nr:MerR family transcriptional regulator, heat shock protein HspR [Paraoerskovia marina]
MRIDPDAPLLAISQAAELAGMHAQTLRQYDRLGLVSPRRTVGRGRRYSYRDVERLLEVQRLSQDEGINLAGIKRILELERRVEILAARVEALHARVETGTRVFATGSSGETVAVPRGRRGRREVSSRSLVLWRPPQE